MKYLCCLSLLLFPALVCLVASQDPTAEISVDNGVLTLNIAEGTKVSVNYVNSAGTVTKTATLATSDDVGDLQQRIDDLEALVLDMNTTLSNKVDLADLNEVQQSAQKNTDNLVLFQDLLDDLTGDLVSLSDQDKVTETCLGNVVASINTELAQCPSPGDAGNNCPATQAVTHGTFLGTSRTSGSIRSFKCAEGFVLRGEELSTCKNGTWSHPEPKCVAIVDCITTVSDKLLGVWVDGEPVAFTGQQSWYSFRAFQFTSDAETLALKFVAGPNKWSEFGQLGIYCSSYGDHEWHDISKLSNWKATTSTEVDAVSNEFAKDSFDVSSWSDVENSKLCIRTDKGVCRMGGGGDVPVFVCTCTAINPESLRVAALVPKTTHVKDTLNFFWYRTAF